MAETTTDAEAPQLTIVNAEATEKQAKQKAPARKARRRRGKRKPQATALRVMGGVAPFPRTTLEAALDLGNAIQQHAAGQRIRRATLFEKLDKSPDSGPSRALVTNSGKYAITTGGYQAEFLELTPLGAAATEDFQERTIDCPAWTRTTILRSKAACPAVGRRGRAE